MIRHFDDPLAPAPLRDIPHIMQHALLTAGLPNSLDADDLLGSFPLCR